MFNRLLKPPKTSFILLGARGTGKSTWVKQHFAGRNVIYYDLLLPKDESRLRRNPDLLISEVQALPKNVKWVVIDEIQKVPKLLDCVHYLIENSKVRFALTGSSARKLKHGTANLLAGRAIYLQMYSLTMGEMASKETIASAMNWGGLPKVHLLKNREQKTDYLHSYCHLYLKEEIAQEQIIRKLDPFSDFLAVAAQMDGKIMNFSKIANEIDVDTKTVISYFHILEDTLLGTFLPAYHRSIRKRQRQNPKFYFYDLGVRRALENQLDVPLKPKTYEWGRAFESLVFNEFVKANSYNKKKFTFSFLHTDNGEIDLIIEKGRKVVALVEIKSNDSVSQADVKTLQRFSKDFRGAKLYILSLDPRAKKIDGINCMFWQDGIKNLM